MFDFSSSVIGRLVNGSIPVFSAANISGSGPPINPSVLAASTNFPSWTSEAISPNIPHGAIQDMSYIAIRPWLSI